MTKEKVRTEDRAEMRRRKVLEQNEAKRSTGVISPHGPHYHSVHHHVPRKIRQIIDREAIGPATRLFAAGTISRAEMMARISPR